VQPATQLLSLLSSANPWRRQQRQHSRGAPVHLLQELCSEPIVQVTEAGVRLAVKVLQRLHADRLDHVDTKPCRAAYTPQRQR